MHCSFKSVFIFLSAFAAILTGCNDRSSATRHSGEGDDDPVNSIYYWRTVFRLDPAEYAFLDNHDIGEIYIRMFDVCKDVNIDHRWRVVPNATMRFEECDTVGAPDPRLADKRFTPVVYITLDALKEMNGKEAELAELIVERVANMCSYNMLPNVRKLQLDCDWTISTEPSYFALCQAVKDEIAARDLPWKLSSTIRLHQLARQAPPVDHGVLMVYNTGKFNDPDVDNSILNADDVRPYIKWLSGYQLPLDIAYPIYGWQLIFRHRKFMGIKTGIDVTDTSVFERLSSNHYRVKYRADGSRYGLEMLDVVRNELSSYGDIVTVKALIDEQLKGRQPHSNVLYHLDSSIITNFSNDEIDTFYSR